MGRSDYERLYEAEFGPRVGVTYGCPVCPHPASVHGVPEDAQEPCGCCMNTTKENTLL